MSGFWPNGTGSPKRWSAWPSRLRRSLTLFSQIDACDREIGRLNAISTAKFGHIPIVLSGAAPAIAALFQDAVVWDAFIAVAGLQSPPVVSGGAGAKDKLHAKRSASSPAAV